MRWLQISTVLVFAVVMAGCAKEDSKGISTVDPSSSTPTVDGTMPDSENNAPSDSGAPAAGPTGTSMAPGSNPSGVSSSGSTPNLPPADKAAVASMTIPLYPGATKGADAPDTTETANGESTTVVTRFTKDDFAKVKAFYADKAKWTEKNEVDGLIIYESVNGKNREIVGINDQGDLRSIVVTKITKK